jgi:hypothetical protein
VQAEARPDLGDLGASVVGSPTSPSNTWIAIGQPSAAQISPITICSLSRRPSRL